MKQLRNITIVGGGSAAWLAAAYIQNNFWDLPLTVIDKEVGNPIGVGEATVLTFPQFLRQCGLHLPEWFKGVDGTYKAGIDFPGCLLYTSPSPRDRTRSRMPSSA